MVVYSNVGQYRDDSPIISINKVDSNQYTSKEYWAGTTLESGDLKGVYTFDVYQIEFDKSQFKADSAAFCYNSNRQPGVYAAITSNSSIPNDVIPRLQGLHDKCEGLTTPETWNNTGVVTIIVKTSNDNGNDAIYSENIIDYLWILFSDLRGDKRRYRDETPIGSVVPVGVTSSYIPPYPKLILDLYSEDLEMGVVSGGGKYEISSGVEISAFPLSGYTFKEWKYYGAGELGNRTETASAYTVFMDNDYTFVAYFNLASGILVNKNGYVLKQEDGKILEQ